MIHSSKLRALLFVAVACTSLAARAECGMEPDELGRLVEGFAKLPTNSRALDGWVLVPRGASCDAIAVSNVSARSALEQARGVAGIKPDERVIFYVNGVANTPAIACDVLHELEEATGARVFGVYNGTDGLLGDLFQTFKDRTALPLRNEATVTLALVIKSELRAGRGVEIFAHSQGGAIASKAIGKIDGDRSKIQVTTFGSAAPLWPSGPRYEHYVNRSDDAARFAGLTDDPWLDPLTAGKGARVVRFGKEGHSIEAHLVDHAYLARWKKDHPKQDPKQDPKKDAKKENPKTEIHK